LTLTAITPPAATIANAAIPIVGWDDFIALLPIVAERNPIDGQGAKLTLAIGNRAMKSGGDKNGAADAMVAAGGVMAVGA
jgi:hypothetical protein